MLLDKLEKVWYNPDIVYDSTIAKIYVFVRFIYFDHFGNPKPIIDPGTHKIFIELKKRL